MTSFLRRSSRVNIIDVTFDFRDDTREGGDPDALSPTLRRYHRLLWSKALPSGHKFDLDDARPKKYLHHQSAIGEFWLSSDSVVPSFRKLPSISVLIPQLPRGMFDRYMHLGYTIGGMMLFPSNMVDRRMTINGARGCHPRIKDRFDLTVECIRRHYYSEVSPLSAVLGRYSDYFALFGSFEGYVDFFLLQDIVSADYSTIVWHAPFTGFDASPVPSGLDAYLQYLVSAEAFI